MVVEELRQGEEILEKHREEEVEDMFNVKLLVRCHALRINAGKKQLNNQNLIGHPSKPPMFDSFCCRS